MEAMELDTFYKILYHVCVCVCVCVCKDLHCEITSRVPAKVLDISLALFLVNAIKW